MWTIAFPWPPKCLSPNGRAHWAVKAKAAAQVRRDASILCQSMGARALGWDRMHVAYEFRPATRRTFDTDNALSRCKALGDGIADATGVDDSKWTITIRRGEPVKGGAVVVTISKMERE